MLIVASELASFVDGVVPPPEPQPAEIATDARTIPTAPPPAAIVKKLKLFIDVSPS
jgi:hypothetical protein